MAWSIGYDDRWNRDIGYGVPAQCDHPQCKEAIDRGLAYLCSGCGLFFCSPHLVYQPNEPGQLCVQCNNHMEPFTPSSDTLQWVSWKLTDKSWETWRQENPDAVEKLRQGLT